MSDLGFGDNYSTNPSSGNFSAGVSDTMSFAGGAISAVDAADLAAQGVAGVVTTLYRGVEIVVNTGTPSATAADFATGFAPGYDYPGHGTALGGGLSNEQSSGYANTGPGMGVDGGMGSLY